MINRDKLVELERDGLHKAFKLQTTTTVTSMCAFDENLCLQKYDSVLQILKGFYKVRLETYHKRKEYLEGILQAEASKLSNQARFILEKCDGTIVIENKKYYILAYFMSYCYTFLTVYKKSQIQTLYIHLKILFLIRTLR